MTTKSYAREISKEYSHYLHIFLLQGNTSFCTKRCGKKSTLTTKLGKKQKQADSKKQSTKKPVMKSKNKAVIHKKPKEKEKKLQPIRQRSKVLIHQLN